MAGLDDDEGEEGGAPPAGGPAPRLARALPRRLAPSPSGRAFSFFPKCVGNCGHRRVCGFVFAELAKQVARMCVDKQMVISRAIHSGNTGGLKGYNSLFAISY